MSMIHPYLFRPTTSHRYVLTNTNNVGIIVDIFINNPICVAVSPPLCMYYRWIDTKMPDWAVAEIRKRGQRAWASFHREEQREKAAAKKKAEEERELNEDKAK